MKTKIIAVSKEDNSILVCAKNEFGLSFLEFDTIDNKIEKTDLFKVLAMSCNMSQKSLEKELINRAIND